MKPTKSILILLSLFLMFSCDDNSVEPLICDEGLTDIDGVCTLVCDEGLTIFDGECFYQGDLDVLQDIIDVNESLIGEEPLEIGVLQSWVDGRLDRLDLRHNQLISIPESIGNLSSLRYLILYNNQLTSIPESIGNLSNLTSLDLILNQLNNIPVSIGNLSSLVTLWLFYNQLTTLPESICNLPSDCSIGVDNHCLSEDYHFECINDWGEQDCDD